MFSSPLLCVVAIIVMLAVVANCKIACLLSSK